jgi:hypothetical protein
MVSDSTGSGLRERFTIFRRSCKGRGPRKRSAVALFIHSREIYREPKRSSESFLPAVFYRKTPSNPPLHVRGAGIWMSFFTVPPPPIRLRFLHDFDVKRVRGDIVDVLGIIWKIGPDRPQNRGFWPSKPQFWPFSDPIGPSDPPAKDRCPRVIRNFEPSKMRSLAGDGAVLEISGPEGPGTLC